MIENILTIAMCIEGLLGIILIIAFVIINILGYCCKNSKVVPEDRIKVLPFMAVLSVLCIITIVLEGVFGIYSVKL